MAELRFGVARLPAGRRRNGLIEQLESQVLPTFAGRVLNFDLAATRNYAEAMARAQAHGRPVGVADGFIAAIAAANGMAVASRDTAPFAAMGVAVADPWAD